MKKSLDIYFFSFGSRIVRTRAAQEIELAGIGKFPYFLRATTQHVLHSKISRR